MGLGGREANNMLLLKFVSSYCFLLVRLKFAPLLGI